MTEETSVPKPLTEQIIDEMLAVIDKREEFDQSTAQRLRRLAQDGCLTKAKQVTETISVA